MARALVDLVQYTSLFRATKAQDHGRYSQPRQKPPADPSRRKLASVAQDPMHVDRDCALIGSANLDVRSTTLDFELVLLVYDTDFAS
jgi:hypothetical protein